MLVQAGDGGVGFAAVPLVHRAGSTVLATASNPDKLRRPATLGLDHGVHHTDTDMVAEVHRLTGGRVANPQ